MGAGRVDGGDEVTWVLQDIAAGEVRRTVGCAWTRGKQGSSGPFTLKQGSVGLYLCIRRR